MKRKTSKVKKPRATPAEPVYVAPEPTPADLAAPTLPARSSGRVLAPGRSPWGTGRGRALP